MKKRAAVLNRLMSGRLRMEGINEGFDRLHDGRAVREIVEVPS